MITSKNAVILPNFLVWKLCGKAHFLLSFEVSPGGYAETAPFCKPFAPSNYVKLLYFSQWVVLKICLFIKQHLMHLS